MKKSVLKKILWFALFMVLGGAIGFIAAKAGLKVPKASLPDWTGAALIILFIPIAIFVVAFHEGGHALAGVGVRFDFRMYVVGPFMWEKQKSGWHFKWNRNVNTAGGMVVCLPPDSINLKNRFMIFAAGGPMASLVLTMLSYAGFKVLNNGIATGSETLQFISFLFGFIGFFSFVIFLATAIPFHAGGFSSDGARVWRFMKGGETSRFEILILKIISGSASGIRPRLLDVNELQEAVSLAVKLKSPYKVYLYSYLYQVALDQDDFIQAEIYLQKYIDKADQIPDGIRNSVWLEAAFFYAYAKDDQEKAISFWNRFKPAALISKAQIYASEAALAKLNQNREVALSKIELSLQELPNMLDQGISIALRERLHKLKQQVLSLP